MGKKRLIKLKKYLLLVEDERLTLFRKESFPGNQRNYDWKEMMQ
jgi:hypothetical protein